MGETEVEIKKIEAEMNDIRQQMRKVPLEQGKKLRAQLNTLNSKKTLLMQTFMSEFKKEYEVYKKELDKIVTGGEVVMERR